MRLMRRIGRMGRMGLMGPMGPMGPMGLIGLIGLMGLMGLMGCSGDSAELPEPTPEPTPVVETAITFSGQQGAEQAVTRANGTTRAGTPLSDAGVTSFKVWGYKNNTYNELSDSYGDPQEVFPGYTVKWLSNSAATTTTNSSGWEYVLDDPADQTIKYWDWGSVAYRFFAVTGTQVSGDLALGQYKTNMANMPNGPYEITLAADASSIAGMGDTPYYSLLWFSTGNYSDYPTQLFGQPVQLTFMKPFARVRIIFKYTYPREGITLTNISFKPTDNTKIARKGTVTVSYPLTGTATKETFSSTRNASPAEGEELTEFDQDYDPEDDGKVYAAPVKDGWYTVFPNMDQGKYTLSVKVNGGDRTAVVPAKYMQWLPGYSYTYIFKVTEEGGVEIGWVEYAMTPWTEMEVSPMVYNW